MTSINFTGARDYILDKLTRSLPSNLHYHSVRHTVSDVIPALNNYITAANLNGDECVLLETAAYYHDCGYLKFYHANESAAVAIASEVLPGFGYSPAQIERIGQMIMSTQLPQKPDSFLDEILCDADLDSLGREDFFVTSHLLRLELAENGQPTGIREWYESQLAFLQSHSYFTEAARAIRDEGKEKNIEEIKKLLGSS